MDRADTYQGSALPLSYGSLPAWESSPARPEGNSRGPGGWQDKRIDRLWNPCRVLAAEGIEG